jgi:glutaredoxin
MKKLILIILIAIGIIVSGVYLVYNKKNISNKFKSEEMNEQDIDFIDYNQDVVQDINEEKNQENNEEIIEESKDDKDKILHNDKEILIAEKKVEEKNDFDLIKCLYDAKVIIYGSRTCPYCVQLVESFNGYDAVDLIYVECTENRDRCINEMKSDYVPEIQIDGNLYTGERSPEGIANEVNCIN